MRKIAATAGSAVFLAIAPGVVAGLVPWWLTGWRMGAALPAPLRVLYRLTRGNRQPGHRSAVTRAGSCGGEDAHASIGSEMAPGRADVGAGHRRYISVVTA